MLARAMLIVVVLQLLGSPHKVSAAASSAADTSIQQSTPASSQETSGDSNAAQQTPQPPPAASPELSRPTVAPMPATTGAPGIFNVETAESLPKGVFTVSAYTSKFGRAPGSVTILSGGASFAAGLTNKITVFAQFEPYRHLHIGEPAQLSLRQPPGCLHDVFKAPIYCGVNSGPLNNSWHGPAAAYVSDFPFAAYNKSDYGPVTLGLKANFWSETRGDPLSVSVGASFMIPTESSATELAKFGAQTGTLNYSFTLALSKTFSRGIMLANNVTYLATRNPHIGSQTLLTPGDEMIFGQGFVFRAQHRLQFLTEFTCNMVQEGHAFGLIGIDTENTSLGPSNPVDGVWGARWYFLDSAALDVGYRYMLNLHQLNDRSGFTIKISKVIGWKKQ
jgi:hypothetical protein